MNLESVLYSNPSEYSLTSARRRLNIEVGIFVITKVSVMESSAHGYILYVCMFKPQKRLLKGMHLFFISDNF